jgi:hypothetical protein
MTDFHYLDARVCAQVIAWRGVVGTHEVKWCKAPTSHPYQMWMTCDCKGFKYRATCRHVIEAQAKRCNWGAGAFSGSPSTPNADGTCPECGGPTQSVRVAV